MTVAQAVQDDGPLLAGAAHGAIVKALRIAWQQKTMRSNRPTEPEIVACLMLHAAPELAANWRHILSRHGVQFTAATVFCHARPIVDYGGTKNTELGDILLVHRHQDRAGTVRRNALLFQAKVSSAQPHAIGRGEAHQLQLYRGWPDFSYITPRSLRGQLRQVQPKTWHRGAQYLQIDDRPPWDQRSGLLQGFPYFPAGACLPENPLIIHHDLAIELLAWLGGFSGRPFRDRASTVNSSGWSRVVWDLMASALGSALRWRRTHYRSTPRYSGDNLQAIDGAYFFTDPGHASNIVSEAIGRDAEEMMVPPNDDIPSQRSGDDEPGEGISLFALDTRDEE